MSIGTLEQVWVVAEVFERQAAEVKIGLPVTMTLDYLPGKRMGVEKLIMSTPHLMQRPERSEYAFVLNNDDDLLKPNMFAQVLIHADSSKKQF